MTRTLLALAFLLPAISAFSQDSVPGPFFGGDTLQGFDTMLAYTKAVGKGLQGMELKNELRRSQVEFVRRKYHLPIPVQAAAPALPLLINSTCNNLDFESGTYTGWVGAIGYNKNCQTPLTVAKQGISSLGINAAETSCSYHTLVTSASGVDPYSGLPVVDPSSGGMYSLRLGGENINVNHMARGTCPNADTISTDPYSNGEYIQQSMAITSSNTLLTYSCMVILSSSSHDTTESPYFRVELLDMAGNKLSRDYYVLTSGSTPPAGFQTSSSTANAFPVYYRPWTAKSINLAPYIGQTITIRFTTAGCVPGGHFAYAYIDATCGQVKIQNIGGSACQGQTAYYNAPASGGTYQWKTVPSGTAGIVGPTNTQTVAINASGTYEVLVSPSPGTPYTIDTTITFNPSPVVSLTKVDASCGSCADGTASALVTGGNSPYSYSWSPAVTAGQGTANISSTPGTYTCLVTSGDGCTTSGTVVINFSTGLSAATNNIVFSVSPNPFNNTLKVDLGASTKEATVIVYDLVGKEVLRQQMSTGTAVLNTSGFAPGVYLLAVKSSGGNYLRKLIRQ